MLCWPLSINPAIKQSFRPVWITVNVKKPKICFVLATLLLSCQITFAYDSSGGVRTDNLLSKVVFQDNSKIHEIKGTRNPIYFSWSRENRNRFLVRMKQILEEMPLDVVDIPESAVENIVVSNSLFVLNPEFAKTLSQRHCSAVDRKQSENNAMKDADFGGSVIRFSANILEAKMAGRPSGVTEMLPETVLHEFVHVWHAWNREKAEALFTMRYNDIRKLWSDLTWKEDNAFDKLDVQYGELSDADPRMRQAIEDYEKKAEIILSEKHWPCLFGGKTGRRPYNFIGHNGIDTHAMSANGEYFAELAESIWADPELAASQYLAEEITWVKNNVFKNHPVVPWQYKNQSQNSVAGLPKMGIDLKRQFETVESLHVDWR